MNEVATVERENMPALEATSFISMIERAARDPSVDIDKMERLTQMYERTVSKQAEMAFHRAMATMQAELPEMPERGAIKNKAGGIQSKYALWEDVNQILKPILTRHGFSLTFPLEDKDGKTVVHCVLAHTAGHSVRSSMKPPADSSGSKNEIQGQGSSIAYAKRYLSGAMLNLTSRGEDDDGQGGGMPDSTEADWNSAIDAVADDAAAAELWKKISAATTQCRDVPANDRLRARMMAKRRTFKKVTP